MACNDARTAITLCLLAIVGCGGSDFEVAPTAGVVLLDGRPLTQGKVMFAPASSGESIEGGKAGFGNLGPDGRFVVSTYGEEDGAVVADHTVTVINTDPKSTEGKRFKANRVALPERVRVVPGQDNEVTIELTADLVKKYGMRFD